MPATMCETRRGLSIYAGCAADTVLTRKCSFYGFSYVIRTLQEALLGERGKLLEALQREEAHAAAVAAACSGAGASADPAGDPGVAPAAPADARPPASDSTAGAMAIDEAAAVDGATEVGGRAAAGGAEEVAEGDADALDAYMSSVRTQIELDKARTGSTFHT